MKQSRAIRDQGTVSIHWLRQLRRPSWTFGRHLVSRLLYDIIFDIDGPTSYLVACRVDLSLLGNKYSIIRNLLPYRC